MFNRAIVLSCTVAVFLASSVGVASADVIANLSPAWVLLPGSLGPNGGTWGLPADLSAIGCGSENETTCEPTGMWGFDKPFVAADGYWTMVDPDQSIGDIVVFGNFGPGGNGQVRFYSDPNLNVNLAGLFYDGVLCSEGPDGCIGTFALSFVGGGLVTIDAASDGENTFDPFGFGVDTSDDIRFTGVQVVDNVPEPSSLALFAITLLSLMGFGLMRRRTEA